jgi:hypothetical protein
MTTLKVGIASYDEMKARTMAVAQGKRCVKADEPKVWFTSTESFAKVLSAGNRELLRVIAKKGPGSPRREVRVICTWRHPMSSRAQRGTFSQRRSKVPRCARDDTWFGRCSLFN